jgi:hypothetical protein
LFFSEPYFFCCYHSPDPDTIAFSAVNFTETGKTSVIISDTRKNEFVEVYKTERIIEIYLFWIDLHRLAFYFGGVLNIYSGPGRSEHKFPAAIIDCRRNDTNLYVITSDAVYQSPIEEIQFDVFAANVKATSFSNNRLAALTKNNTIILSGQENGSGQEKELALPEILKNVSTVSLTGSQDMVFLSEETILDDQLRNLKIYRFDTLSGELSIFVDRTIALGLGHPRMKWMAIDDRNIIVQMELASSGQSGVYIAREDNIITAITDNSIDVFDFNYNKETKDLYISGTILRKNEPANKEKLGFICRLTDPEYAVKCIIPESHSFFRWTGTGGYTNLSRTPEGDWFFSHRQDENTLSRVLIREHNTTYELQQCIGKDCYILKRGRPNPKGAVLYLPGLHRYYSFGIKDLFFHYALEQIQTGLIEKGYDAICINLPGSSGYGADFRRQLTSFSNGINCLFQEQIKGLAARYEGELILMAGSLGALTVLHGLHNFDVRLRVVLVSPMFHLELTRTSGYRSLMERPDPVEFIPHLQIAPGVKILLIHGVQDLIADPLYASQFAMSHNCTRLFSLAEEGHVFRQYNSWIKVLNNIESFIQNT